MTGDALLREFRKRHYTQRHWRFYEIVAALLAILRENPD